MGKSIVYLSFGLVIGFMSCDGSFNTTNSSKSLDSTQITTEIPSDSSTDNEEMEEVEVATGSN